MLKRLKHAQLDHISFMIT